MNNLDKRMKRLEEQHGACNHRSPVILANRTEEEVERTRKELDECPSCRKGERPKMVIMRYPALD